tara:strand:+ start:11302 stop:11586 length:285 start_codon:yes stop_codon:yes gene_type:complete
MKKIIVDSWASIMIMEKSPLGNIPNLMVRHMAFQILAWMWCIIFSMIVGSYLAFGISVIAHTLLLAGIFITFSTYHTANSLGSKQGTFEYRGDE